MSPAVTAQQTGSNDSTAASNFLVWPLEKITQDQINNTDAAIRKIAGPGNVVEKTLDSDGNLTFWYCLLSAKQKAAVDGLDMVAEVEKDGIDLDAQLSQRSEIITLVLHQPS
ncbi:hypothetical protein LTS10_010331 [Elasticomyces elasticus]|nr:hypothetical protein LTS10_010331 [Elasticomyces elasticus]